jgi:hypothetical protein
VTGSKSAAPQYGDLIRAIALGVGLLLLADSLSQLIQAAGNFELGSRNWRLVNIRLLLTQVTPLTIGLLLVGQFLIRPDGGWRRAGWIALGFGVGVGILIAVYAMDSSALVSTLSGAPLGQQRRNLGQVLISGSAFAFGLLGSAVFALRAKVSTRPA